MVIDKETLDCVLCSKDYWHGQIQMLQGIHDVLVDQGVYICVSYGLPEQRKHYFETIDLNWSV